MSPRQSSCISEINMQFFTTMMDLQSTIPVTRVLRGCQVVLSFHKACNLSMQAKLSGDPAQRLQAGYIP